MFKLLFKINTRRKFAAKYKAMVAIEELQDI
jgi:hypothetical protein